MARLVMWNLQTLDGYFEGPKAWDLEFHMTAWGEELEQMSGTQLKETGHLLFGRATYEGMAAHWTQEASKTGEPGAIVDFMNSVPKIVFSKSLTSADWNNTRLVKTDAAEEVARLKREAGRDLFVFGSAALSDALIRKGLFDEYRVCIAPMLLGAGAPLWKPNSERRRLTLLDARALKTGAVILRYVPYQPAPA